MSSTTVVCACVCVAAMHLCGYAAANNATKYEESIPAQQLCHVIEAWIGLQRDGVLGYKCVVVDRGGVCGGYEEEKQRGFNCG